jgi:1-acyl-sn-glycerol-3-phosphate acyltransferase
MTIIGRENFPVEGPLLVVGNHFSFIDPVAMLHVAPRQVEFVAGTQRPNAPPWSRWIPRIWGYYPIHRGGVSHYGLRASEAVLRQGGVLGIFPEAGSWATVLRPPRPGAAFLAARTGVPILPIGFEGLTDVLPFRPGKRAPVTVRVGEPFGPFHTSGKGRQRRRQLDEIGDEIMRRIAALIPPERRGHYSADPAIRAAAQGTEVYPWDERSER